MDTFLWENFDWLYMYVKAVKHYQSWGLSEIIYEDYKDYIN